MTYAPTVEEVAESNGDGHRWYQLYWPQDDDITISLLKRAKANGYKVLVVTLDTWALAWRPADLDGGYVPFMKGVGDRTGFTGTPIHNLHLHFTQPTDYSCRPCIPREVPKEIQRHPRRETLRSFPGMGG
jgi:hypothetical protein